MQCICVHSHSRGCSSARNSTSLELNMVKCENILVTILIVVSSLLKVCSITLILCRKPHTVYAAYANEQVIPERQLLVESRSDCSSVGSLNKQREDNPAACQNTLNAHKPLRLTDANTAQKTTPQTPSSSIPMRQSKRSPHREQQPFCPLCLSRPLVVS